MSVVVSVEEVGTCRKQVRIAVPAPAVEAETQRVVQEFRKRARLPGFRKGKVPVALVEKRFREDIDKEVVERLCRATGARRRPRARSSRCCRRR